MSKQLLLRAENNNIFEKCHSGFRKHHSTENAFLRVSNDLSMEADDEMCSVLVLLDLSPPVDTVDHSILFCSGTE